jgi:hypothetical protein
MKRKGLIGVPVVWMIYAMMVAIPMCTSADRKLFDFYVLECKPIVIKNLEAMPGDSVLAGDYCIAWDCPDAVSGKLLMMIRSGK